MSDKVITEENLDEIVKNVVQDIKKGKEFSEKEIDKLMAEANENLEFTKKLNEIKLEAPDNRVIFVDGNEYLMYDHGEFFICETTDSRRPKKKLKRKEATERYIEYFIRYQLNPIIEQKNMYNISKSIQVTEIDKQPQHNFKTVEKKITKKMGEVKQTTSTPKVKETSKTKAKNDLAR